MSTITREHLRERAREKVKSLEFAVTQTAFADSRAELEEELELARIALASLEAEPVAYVMADDLKDSSIISTPAYRDLGEAMERTVGDVVALFTAPPAPVSVPDFSALDRLAGEMLTHAMNCERRVSVAYTHCAHRLAEEVRDLRAAMLQGAEPVTTAYKLPELTDSQCLEFLAVAFRHASIKGDIEFDDIRLGLKMALEAAPQQEVKP